VLEQLDAQVVGPRGQHPPHRAGLVAVQVGEDRIAEVRAGRVARGHAFAVVLVERLVERLDRGLVGIRHR
jgi:hypothetical protein